MSNHSIVTAPADLSRAAVRRLRKEQTVLPLPVTVSAVRKVGDAYERAGSRYGSGCARQVGEGEFVVGKGVIADIDSNNGYPFRQRRPARWRNYPTGRVRMSVIHLEGAELANLAVLAVGGSTASTAAQERLCYYCEAIAGYSHANTQAFRHSYREPAQAVTAAQRLALASQPKTLISASRERARKTIALLAYNAVANDGTDCLDGATVKGLLSIAVQFVQ
jgi:hypothetical protein